MTLKAMTGRPSCSAGNDQVQPDWWQRRFGLEWNGTIYIGVVDAMESEVYLLAEQGHVH
jgi:hypothetical protein